MGHDASAIVGVIGAEEFGWLELVEADGLGHIKGGYLFAI